MGLGKVDIVTVDTVSGDFANPERVFLFVGLTGLATGLGVPIAVSADSDLDTLFGDGDSELKTQIAAAIANAKSNNFACYALPLAAETDWDDAVLAVLDNPLDLDVEAVVLCSPVTTKAEVEACATFAAAALSQFAKFLSVHACCAGVAADETWAEYAVAVAAMVDGVAADRVSLTPLLHGNDLGVIAGRLCNPAVTIADTPMRVATGALVGLGADPTDSADAEYTQAIALQLSALRLSVAQTYTGYAGTYWGDHMMLAAEGGDFQAYENLRVIDYLSRRVRVLAIARIGDRRLNSTAKSIAGAKTYFARPLREASHSVLIAGVEFPGLVKPPSADAIAIDWPSNTSVTVAITAQPYNCPKQITAYLALDLS
jgi:hypothetical protein